MLQVFARGASPSLRFKCPTARWHGTVVTEEAKKNPIAITFKLANGDVKPIKAFAGQTVLEAAHDNDIALEGACEGSLACSTCHGVIEKGYEKFPRPSEREEDLLDQAPGLSAKSRLCCQLRLKSQDLHNNIEIRIPKITRNFYVDGHVPKPH